MPQNLKMFISCFILSFAGVMFAASVTVPMYVTGPHTKPGTYVGTVLAKDSQYGLLLTPDLHHLLPALSSGLHGFHVHVRPSCTDNGMAAGGHLDPTARGKHLGPYNPDGHLGDLPALYVDSEGNANLPVLAPKLTVDQILNHALMIHAGGDNYSDQPDLGGGGARMICGVIPKVSKP